MRISIKIYNRSYMLDRLTPQYEWDGNILPIEAISITWSKIT
jgi:hypothetical protein